MERTEKVWFCKHVVLHNIMYMLTAMIIVENHHFSTSPVLGFGVATFVPSLVKATVLPLASSSFRRGSFFPSALPILSNSCASVARGGPARVLSSSPSSHAGDGERLCAVDTWPCVLALALLLRGGTKRRRGVQSSDGEKSGCSG